MRLLHKALLFAKQKHAGQWYNDGDFIQHPIRVAQRIASDQRLKGDINLRCAAFLHDVIEDCDVSYEVLVREFNEDIANLVREVTKDGYNSFPWLKTRRGVILKFYDRADNLTSMIDWPLEKQNRYIEKSKFWKGGE